MSSASKPKLAVLFGEWLVRGQIETFVRLKEQFDITLFVWATNTLPLDDIELHCQIVHGLETYSGPRKNAPSRIILRLLEQKFGGSFVPGLPAKLKQFDVVYTAETYGVWTEQALEAKKANPKLKVIVNSAENLPFRRHSGITLRSKLASFAAADRFVAITEQAKDVLIAEGARPELIDIVPLSVDSKKFCPGPKAKEFAEHFMCSPDDAVILFVGRILWVKGVTDLIEAFARLRTLEIDLFNRSKLVLIGDGPDRQLAQEYISMHHLEERTTFLNRMDHNRLPDVYRNADIFVAPSLISREWEEQFGVVLIEAMACAIPVISTQTGAIPEVVKDCAVLIPSHDIEQLALRLIELLRSSTLRKDYGERARKLVCDQYDAQIVEQKLATVIMKTLEQVVAPRMS